MKERFDGAMKRPNPMLVMITNAGAGSEIACWDDHSHAINVANGDMEDDSYFSYVCALDKDDQPFKDEKSCWVKTNPSLPGTPGYPYVRDQVAKAKGMPSRRSQTERFQFCIWTDAVDAWIDRDAWLEIEVEKLQEDLLAGRPCYVGLDLSRTRDLTAAVLVWELADGTYAARCSAWVPEGDLSARSRAENTPYEKWVKQGHLNTTPGKTIDYSFVAEWIKEMHVLYSIEALVYDQWGMKYFRQDMRRAGLELTESIHGEGLYAIPHSQSFLPGAPKEEEVQLWMNQSIKTLEDVVLNKKIKAEKNPVFRAGVLGARVVEDGHGNRKLTKKHEKARTDPMVALTMGIGYANSLNKGSSLLDYYEGKKGVERARVRGI